MKKELTLIQQMELISETGSYPSDDAYEKSLQTIAQWLVNAAVRDSGQDVNLSIDDNIGDYLGDTITSLREYIEQAHDTYIESRRALK